MYENAQDFENGALWYSRRCLFRGAEEEYWMALWRWGACLLMIGRFEEGVERLLAATRIRPWRAEPYWIIAEYFHQSGQWEKSYVVCETARQECRLEDDPPGGGFGGDHSFILLPAYEWCIDFEQSVSAYHIGKYEEGMRLIERLEKRSDLPEEITMKVQAMRRHYETAMGD